MWPYGSEPACVLRDPHGGTFIVQPSNTPTQTIRHRQNYRTENVRTACVSQDSTLICIENKMLQWGHKVSEYPLTTRPDGTRCIGPRSRVSNQSGNIDDQAKVVSVFRENSLQIKICTIKGKIINYRQSL